eukprot:TRINITY_DN1227_c0_g1_i1.p1 TRINITY_DN1227_c0_g1~~TRINITY_DN1227_c0_g1_i1.p1  ORF type:complete len:864 (+),score=147.02 TRINITY_DN1227_c0_g1_i1:31-2622(+)
MIEIFYIVQGLFSGFSFLGSILIVASSFTIPDLRKHPTTLVLYLSVCDLLFSLKYLVVAFVPDSEDWEDKSLHQQLCMWEAIWSQFFGIASISWNAMISINLMMSIANPFANTATKEIIYHFFVWSLAVSTTTVLALKDFYQPSGDGTCWLNGRDEVGWGLFYGFLVAYQLLAISALIYVGVRTGNLAKAEEYQSRVLFRMGLYVVIFIATWLGPLSHEVYQFYTSHWNGHRSFETFFTYWDMIGVSIQGLANAFVWFTNPTFFVAFKEKYLKRCFSDEEYDPNARGIVNHTRGLLEDKRNDIQGLTLVLRKNILTCILLSIRHSLEALALADPLFFSNGLLNHDLPVLTKKDCTEVRQYILEASDIDLESSEGFLNTSSREEKAWKSVNDGTPSSSPYNSIPSSQQQQQELFASNSFTFHDISPKAFERIRELSGVNPMQYRKALHPRKFLKRVNDQKFTDGRSGSFFCFSPDKQFILKTIPKSESKMLYDIMWHYTKHIEDNPETLLVRFYGSYVLKPPHANSIYIVVLQNVFNYPYRVHETFDLKGSWVNRGGDGKEFTIGKDNDFSGRKLKVGQKYAPLITDTLKRDSELLRKLGIMDYSLLVGIHNIANDDTRPPTLDDLSDMTSDLEFTIAPSSGQRSRSNASGGSYHTSSDSDTSTDISRSSSSSSSSSSSDLEESKTCSQEMTSDDSNYGATTTSSYPGTSYGHESSVPLKNTTEEEERSGEQEEDDEDDDEEEERISINDTNGLQPLLDSLEISSIKLLAETTPRDDLRRKVHVTLAQRKATGQRSSLSCVSSTDGTQLYFLGVIDILQEWNATKQVERCFKVGMRCEDGDGISAIDPDRYSVRFNDAMKNLLQ